MAETPEGPQQTREEVNIDQIIKFLQSFGVVLTENRDLLSVLPELIKKLEANITKATGTATTDGLREFSGLTEEQEGKKKKWETKQKRQEKQISRLENELQEAKRTISDLEARNKQNDNDVENRDLSDKNYYKSKYRDLKAKLRTTNEDLGAKTEKIAALGRELASKQEDYDTETQRTRKELTEKEKELAEKKEELQMLRKQHSESFRDQKGKIDESEARIAELGEDLRAKQEDYEKKTQRSRKELAEKEEELAKVMAQLHTIKQQHDESLRSQETKIDELRARNAQLEGERLSLQEDFEKEKQRRKQELNEKENADICHAVLLASQEKVNLLQQELRLHRELLFSRLSYDSAFLIWNGLKSENEILLHTLKERERRKWLKTIPLDHGLDSANSTDNPPTTRRSRRYDKFGRLLRKRQHFRQNRRMLNAANVDQLHQLDPVNLSTAPMDADQVNLLRKGPSFCPTPKDINWQSVYDDLEIFEARLRTAAFFMDSNLDDSPAVPSQLPKVPKDRKWKPPTSRLRKEKIERERVKQHFNDNLRDKETKLKRSEACNEELTRENEKSRKRNENLTTEIEKGKQELRHYVERFNHQEEQRKSDLSLKEIEVNKLKGRLSHSQKEVKRLNDELGQFKSRFAGICEKRVKQDQRKVENILASNQQSEVEKDFRDFFDSSREDARDIIQSLYGSEEEIDVHVYYPRIACTILQTAYEHVNEVKEAVVDLFKVATKNMVLRAPEEGYNFRLKRTEGSFDHFLIPIDELNTSEISTDVLDALLISLKETAHICSLECLKEDVKESSWKKWTEWFDKDESFEHAPTREILSKLDGYIKACIRLTWRMVTQLPPLRLEYHSPRFDRHIHKKTAYQNSTEKNPGNEESSGEEILCYLWPGLLDGGDRLILQGQVICKM